MAEEIEDRFKFLPSARDCGTQNEEVQHLVLTDTINFHLWHVNGSGFQCYRKRSHNCLARVYFDEELRRYVQTVNHNEHPNDEQEILNREFKHYCKVQSQQTNISYEAIHARACELYPRARVLLKSIRKCLSLHRHKEQPRNPRDARDAHVLLMENEQYRKQKDGTDFYFGEVLWMDVATGKEESAQVFGNIEVLRAASDPLVKEMHGDGTFRTVPLIFYQLATLHTVAYGHSFAAAFILMTRKSKQLYVLAIDLVKQKCQELFHRVPAPTIFVADYELALLGAVAECFAGCKSRGCWFHSSQAMYRKACNFGLKTAYTTLQVVRRIIRMGMNLPLLDHSLIPQGLEAIENYFNSASDDIPAAYRVCLNQWFAYIQDFWIDRIGAIRLSVYRAVNRTNNFCESSHRTLNECMNGNHINYFEFIDKLRKLGCKANRDISNAESGMLISEQRKLFYKNRDKQIREKTDQLDRELTGNPDADIQPITEFLKTATEDNPENYPQNDFIAADAVLDNEDFLLEVAIFCSTYENHAPHIQAAFQMLLDPTQVLVPQARPLNRNEPPLQFADPIRIAPQPARRVGRPRLNPLPQPRAINYQPAVPQIARRNAAVYRGRQRGGRRGGRRAVPVAVPVIRPAVEPEPEILAAEMEVDNFLIVQQNQEWLEGEGERQQLVQEFRDEEERVENDLAVPNQRLFIEDCTICTNNEADHLISCCRQFLCLSCIRNINIPRVVDDIAIPLNICPFCREDTFFTAPRMPPA
ncbi:hypothetical protein GHT06_016613 [Daphnia sinensis]|uniref:RING-type domain-containing protein n=1 Tax=Daphnia sinensis TaxID=1820382 RepID=A0AAD5KQH8_9CRUS|nr:hypothetical protein GHT06_016613 [Daphnia sinensis]